VCLLLFVSLPTNGAKLTAPIMDFNNLTNWDRDTIERMIYAVSQDEGYDNPQILVALARHESVFLKYPKVLDTNNKYSYGLYHFQKTTFDNFCVKKYQLFDDIMNPVIQTRCSIRAIKDGYFQKLWYNSYRKISKEL
jgi:hypothetical protein